MAFIDVTFLFILSVMEKLHILLGVAASLLVFLPLLSKKGGRLHVWTGRFFVYFMTFIGVSALILASKAIVSMEPNSEHRSHAVFQVFLGLFLLTAIQQGIYVFRCKVRKKRVISVKSLGFPVLLMTCSLMMIVMGLQEKFLYFVGGFLGFLLATHQIFFWIRHQVDIRDWWSFHLTNMFVSGTLALVALNLEVVSRLFHISIGELPVVVWLIPVYFMMP